MDRRAFLKGSAVAVPVATGVAVMIPNGRRVSCVKGDPGERLYAQLCGDRKRVTTFLDGVEQRGCVTSDEAQGYVVRFVETEKGNIAINHVTREALQETVYGRVHLVISELG